MRKKAHAFIVMPQTTTTLSRKSQLLIISVLAFGLPGLPLPLASGVDESWQAILAHAAIDGLQFGRDIIFNYGPLGVFENTHQLPELFWPQVVWQFSTRFLAAIVMVPFLRGRNRGMTCLFTLCALLFLHTARTTLVLNDSFHYLVLLLCGSTLLGPAIAWWQLVISSVLPALLALVKFNLFLLAAPIVLIAVAYHIRERRVVRAATVAALSVTTLMTGWLAAGQSLGEFLNYMEISLHMASSYVWAMSLPPHPAKLVFAAVLAMGLLWTIVTAHTSFRTWRPSETAAVAILALCLGIAWKHSFTRADPVHMPGFFVLLLFVLLLWPALPLPVLKGQSESRRRVVLALSLLAFGGIFLAARDIMPGAPRSALRNMAANLVFVIAPAAELRKFEDLTEQQRMRVALPAIRAEVRSARVDLHGNEQSIAIANRLNYMPRPIIQSFSVFTPRLDAINRSFLERTKPDFVLARLQPIDNRWPTLEDSGALSIMVSDYLPHLQEKGWLLLKRRHEPLTPGTNVERSVNVSTEWNQRIALTHDHESPVWVSVSIKPTFLGRLIGLLYQPPAVRMEIRLHNGTEQQARLPISMAQSAFVINPSIPEERMFQARMNVLGEVPQVQSFRIVPVGRLAQICYQTPFAITLKHAAGHR